MPTEQDVIARVQSLTVTRLRVWVREGLIKGAVFGAACSLIAVFEGYNSKPTAEGVGRATTRTVVISSVVTLVLDYVLTALFF